MPRQRKSATGKRRGSSKLSEELEKLAAALQRHATYILGHPFRTLWPDNSDLAPLVEKNES